MQHLFWILIKPPQIRKSRQNKLSVQLVTATEIKSLLIILYESFWNIMICNVTKIYFVYGFSWTLMQ